MTKTADSLSFLRAAKNLKKRSFDSLRSLRMTGRGKSPVIPRRRLAADVGIRFLFRVGQGADPYRPGKSFPPAH